MMSSQVGPGRREDARANPSFTMSTRARRLVVEGPDGNSVACDRFTLRGGGGARRDRTDDLMLAKHALSQLSYGPKPAMAPNPQPPGPKEPEPKEPEPKGPNPATLDGGPGKI